MSKPINTTYPTVTIKSLSYNKRMSEETLCFSATVYIDGKRFCIASNRGQGGCTDYDPLNSPNSNARALWDSIKALETDNPGFNLEDAVNDAVSKTLTGRDLKRYLRQGIVLLDSAGEISIIKGVNLGADAAAMISKITERYPEDTVLNLMDFDAAVDLIRATVDQVLIDKWKSQAEAAAKAMLESS